MQLNSEEDEKTSDPLLYDENLVQISRKIFENKSEELLKVYSSSFIDFILSSTQLQGTHNLKQEDQFSFYFFGFPNQDYLTQLAIVLTRWNIKAAFPVKFIKIEGFNDETTQFTEYLNQYTPIIHDIFQHLLTNNFYLMEKEMKELLIGLGIRGFMTMLGFRKTVGSQDLPWPTKEILLSNFNKLNTTLTEEELKRLKNPPRLTVGARALTKHAHRSSEGFWGNVKGTEAEKNELAENVAKLITDECVWINAHILPHSEHIIECRNQKGYGIRWTIKGEFRGFLEPQMEGGHDKKWKH